MKIKNSDHYEIPSGPVGNSDCKYLTRGSLPILMSNSDSFDEVESKISENQSRYKAFNLISGRIGAESSYLALRPNGITINSLDHGVYAISNTNIDHTWIKTEKLKCDLT